MPRKYPESACLEQPPWSRFNEAGADAPEIPGWRLQLPRTQGRFNEAGADAPEIPLAHGLQAQGRVGASMRPGRMPRKYHTRADLKKLLTEWLQ